ncbi:5-formyltetrahydrofolate cyclo-ligase [Pediococcus damnosus]|uniref:5-formyltetrahydrofolate cyclo-ligase n=1 Tax=Pediococcus damnosus TaxID=51663 RepID=UPI0007139217|nr:5-formyltetrahydrofolate cyclo-ligase [Pediococcus damnosus]KRN52867.1 5-formyltetrahydrofolate cyclo-ligase [Pediococcus damnosus]
MQPEKKRQRQIQLSRLQAMSKEQKNQEELALYKQLFVSEEWQHAKSIGVTLSGAAEVNTQPIIEQAKLENKEILIPKTLPKWQMVFKELTDETKLVKSKFEILEPDNRDNFSKSNIDLILVPGLGFATDSHFRLGFGGGYYDRFLSDYRGETVSLVLSVQRFERAVWPVEAHDIKIKKLLNSEA